MQPYGRALPHVDTVVWHHILSNYLRGSFSESSILQATIKLLFVPNYRNMRNA